MNQIVTNSKNSKTIMQVKNHKLKARLVMRTAFLALCAVLFALPVKAQTVVKMKNGNMTVPGSGNYLFYDSGGAWMVKPSLDPNNDVNWARMYQHNETYELTFVPNSTPGTEQTGVVVTFNYLLVNDDYLAVYEGASVASGTLIGTYSNNDYTDGMQGDAVHYNATTGDKIGPFENNGNKLKVMANGPITFRFTSNERFRDHGWDAVVEGVAEFSKPTSPVVLKQKCSNHFEILQTAANSTLYYTVGYGSVPSDPEMDPLNGTQIYNGTPVSIENVTYPVYVKAMARVDGMVLSSDVVTYKFEEAVQAPSVPHLELVEGTNNVHVWTEAYTGNDSYYVRYTTSGEDPTTANPQSTQNPDGYIEIVQDPETKKVDTYITLTEPCTIKAVKRGTTCPDNFSAIVSLPINEVQVPTPTIEFSGTGNTGTATLKCEMPGVTLYYTLDGSDPKEEGNTSVVISTDNPTVISVSLGQTVKVFAWIDRTGYIPSDVAFDTYVGSGSGVNPTSGVVLLDDREDHSWSYYSDGDQPVHSLNPADVKITYFGNGNTVSTLNDANPAATTFTASTNNAVQVGPNENGHTFVYLKTLENNNPEGNGSNYSYTTIPNPFSKRPVYGNDNNTKWRGFYAWRVKAVRGGEITGKSVGDNINAETEITFVPDNEYGMEVELEALWARAYVNTTNSATGLNGGSYERNFVVTTSAITANLNVPVTYSTYNPDGTGGSTNTVTLNASTLNSDTKFEYINLTGGNQVTANNHYLCFGRGISASRNAANVRGMGAASTNALNYMLRLESGRYDEFGFIGSGDWTMSNRVLVKAILGCDYDRASNSNNLLSVACHGGNPDGRDATMFYSTRGVDFSSPLNKDQKVFDCVVKSGTYQENVTNDGAYNHSLYCGHNSASHATGEKHYPGVRYITVEGGNFASINGGRATDTWNDETTYSIDVVSFRARIKGGTIRGSVYGGAADNSAGGSREMIITGGEIRGWVAGGANGRNSGDQDRNARTNGNARIYVGGNAIIGGANATMVNNSAGGQVFGAGRGTLATNNTNENGNGYPEKASVINSYVVVADNATISNGTSEDAANVYGGGNYGYVINTANVYILGGIVKGNVYGGAYGNYNPFEGSTNIIMKGGLVQGSVFGGSNEGGKVVSANVTMTGGTVNGSVFGAGLGIKYSHTTNPQFEYYNEVDDTHVTVSGGEIKNNVYGGGSLGKVNENTVVAVSGGTMKNVYGAGLGTEANAISDNANIGGTTNVTISGGNITQSVYGGGENGAVGYNSTESNSLVTVSGGTIGENVFGGGNNGFTNGPTIVNMDDGTVNGSVFGGAFGKKGKVYVAGLRTVNMRGGTVNKNVYGGSRNANDALSFNPGAFGTQSETASVVNMCGGYVHYQVFASGYFGNVYGSTYAFIGTNAIMNAPHSIAGTNPYNQAYYDNHKSLQIGGSVWAGGDFGNYDGTKFGDPTISGNSCVYVDGTGYDTYSTGVNDTYMNIAGSLYGCGTSCDAGKGTRQIILREYGHLVENPNYNANAKVAIEEPYLMATRSLYSIQRADVLDIDNAHVNFLGQGKINSLVTTEHYSIHEFNHVRVSNGSSLFFNAPGDQIVKFGSYSCDDVYGEEPSYTKIEHAGSTSTLDATPNKIRVNSGSFIMIHHDGVTAGGHERAEGYGELEGFAYMMTEGENETCAYARPRQGTDQGNTIPSGYDNKTDGGWVSYHADKNTFYDSGASGCGTEGSGKMQMPYENHTAASKNGEQYYRIWRYGDKYLYREGVFVAQSDGTSNFSTVDAVIPLSAPMGEGSYFRIKSLSDGGTTINYGADVMTVNAAYTESATNATGNYWMYYDEEQSAPDCWVAGQGPNETHVKAGREFITNNPNVNFGLVAIPQGSVADQQTLLISEASDEELAKAKWYNTDLTENGEVLFRLTYNNALTNNVVWDPITIVFEQVVIENNVPVVKEEFTVKLTVTTLTNIEQNFKTEVYAVMRGTGEEPTVGTYVAKVVLPQYIMNVNEEGEISNWTCLDVTWDANVEAGFDDETFISVEGNQYLTHNDKFAMTFLPGLNFDQTTGWDEYYQEQPLDAYNYNQTSLVLGKTTARDPIAFDFTMYFDQDQIAPRNERMGTLTFKMHFTNYANASPTFERDLYIAIEVWRIGIGAIYYVDGVHGNNLYSGTYPNAAKKNLSGIFNRTNYRNGDYIFVVNTLTADGTLEWNGKQYQEVTLYRYPGRHELADAEDHEETSYWDGYDKEHNACFEGALVKVGNSENTGNLTMNGIVLNGFHDLTGDTKLYPQVESQRFCTRLASGDTPAEYVDLTWTGTYVNPQKPLVEINEGSTLTAYGQSKFVGNYNRSDNGGAVYNAGTFNIYDGSEITSNAVIEGKQGGGVYLTTGAKLQLSDLVTINDNHFFTEGSKADELGINNNVYLPAFASTVTVGTAATTDSYTALDNNSKIGITSLPENQWIYNETNKWYLPIAYSDGGLANYLQNIIDNNIIFDDKNEYDVVSLNNADWTSYPTDYLYFVGTWVTVVKEDPTNGNFDPSDIDTREKLAWAISYANGLNGCEAHPDAEFTLKADLDMNEHIWVPIGSAKTPFVGKFNGNGHVVLGLRSPLNNTNMGMFGITDGAQISDLVAQANFAGGTMKNIGTVIGTMNGGKLSNVEASGTLIGTNNTENIGGLVGLAEGGEIHSGFAVDTITGGNHTIVGGLVGTNGGNLFNSYANVIMSGNNAATTLGGLVGINNADCIVENCYVINPIGPAFAATNNGSINYCYAAKGIENYVGEGSGDITGHGNYDAVQSDIKHVDYMYRDNTVEVVAGQTNNFVKTTVDYRDNHIVVWDGLLSALNEWVRTKNGTSTTYSLWNRPINNAINGDLPILAFPKDQSLATLNSNGKFLQYSTGLDNLLNDYTNPSGIFVYGAVEGVAKTPANDNVKVTIAEDAVLLQADNAGDFKATVGITFDNSDQGQHAVDNLGEPLTYDWHMMSTPLQDAAFGTTYNPDATLGYGQPVDIASMVNGYFPNALPMGAGYEEGVKWDFYTYYEPQYHWINFKRSINNHWHYDEINHTHPNIPYAEADQTNGVFTPGKGYMMAISQDSYMNSTGKLNNRNVTITLTNAEPDGIDFNKGWNLVGNPYQAYLSMAPLGALGYKAFAYNADLGVYSPFVMEASENPATLADCIHPHQAFFVYTATDGAQLLFDKTTMATTEKTDNSYFRGDKINYPLVNIFAENERGNRDMTIIEFNRPEIGGAPEIQGLRNANFHIAASLEGQGYGLLFAPEGTDRVPVRFYTNEDGAFTLTWETMHGNFTSLLLVDNMTGTITDMLHADHYTFDATTDDYASRFYITFAVTDVEEYNEGDNDFAWFDGSEWVINGKGNLDVVDVLGRTIYSTRLTNDQNRVNLNNVAKGVYMLRVSDGNRTKVQKVVVR